MRSRADNFLRWTRFFPIRLDLDVVGGIGGQIDKIGSKVGVGRLSSPRPPLFPLRSGYQTLVGATGFEPAAT
jgi:hypothetical protein